jgi:hypothetical protein
MQFEYNAPQREIFRFAACWPGNVLVFLRSSAYEK